VGKRVVVVTHIMIGMHGIPVGGVAVKCDFGVY
jgi:hypothetical protein